MRRIQEAAAANYQYTGRSIKTAANRIYQVAL